MIVRFLTSLRWLQTCTLWLQIRLHCRMSTRDSTLISYTDPPPPKPKSWPRHCMVRLKPVRLYNVTIVIRFGGLSSFQKCPNNLGIVRVCLTIVVCLPVCLHLVATSHVRFLEYTFFSLYTMLYTLRYSEIHLPPPHHLINCTIYQFY